MNNLHVVHFGVYAATEGVFPPLDTISLAGHNDPNVEVEVDLPDNMIEAGVTKMFVSGSWECWGPADQESEGGHSLHVMVLSDSISADRIANLRAFVEHSLPDADSGPVSLVDHAFVTTDDWSVPTHIATFGSNPWCLVHELGKVVDATREDPVRTLTVDEYRDSVIARHGHMVMAALPTPETIANGSVTYPFWYSIGRSIQDKPELLVTGPLTPEAGHWIVNAACRLYDEGKLALGEIEAGLITEQPLRVIEADPIAANMIHAVDYAVERDVAITALQILWPDVQGRWPDDPDFAGGSFVEPTFPKGS